MASDKKDGSSPDTLVSPGPDSGVELTESDLDTVAGGAPPDQKLKFKTVPEYTKLKLK